MLTPISTQQSLSSDSHGDRARVAVIGLGYWLAPSKLRRTVLVGSERMVTCADGAPEPVPVFDSGVVYRDPVQMAEAAERSLVSGGRESLIDATGVGEGLSAQRGLALA
jgi:hypothetical protein